MEIPTPVPADPRKRLGLYLAGHQCGAALAMTTAQQAREAEGDSDLGRALETFLAEVEDDRDLLRRVQRDLDVEPAGFMGIVVGATDALRRVWRTGGALRRSPLKRVSELELLIAGVTGKLRMWEVLGDLAATSPALQGTDWEALAVQARGQREVLVAHHHQAAREAFAEAGSGASPDP